MPNLKTIRTALAAAELAQRNIDTLEQFSLAGGQRRLSITVDGDPEAENLINHALTAANDWGFAKILQMATGYLHEQRRQAMAALAATQADAAEAGQAGAA